MSDWKDSLLTTPPPAGWAKGTLDLESGIAIGKINFGPSQEIPSTAPPMVFPSISKPIPVGVNTIGVNPKESIGAAKLPLHLWSPLASAYGSLGLLNGAKYGRGNYKATPVLASIYIAAIKRHLSEWEEGVEFDGDGCPHMSAMLANIAILLEARSVGTLVDDRQIRGGYVKEVEALTEIANKIVQIHAEASAKVKHYTIADNKKEHHD